MMGEGLVRNELGTYDDVKVAEKLVAAYKQAIESVADARERSALVYSLGALLKRLKLYEEARVLLADESQKLLPAVEIPILNLQARVFANVGRRHEAVMLMYKLNGLSKSPLWRISEQQMADEFGRFGSN
ncbi:MAG: hypothetical protein IPK97_03085 [Ahniella sp.]|nr:hypothetical protein [Ahniella sp.]